MLTIVIGVVVGVIIDIVFRTGGHSTIFCLIVSLIIALSMDMESKVVTRTIYLSSLQDNMGVDGSFFLGSGTVNNQWVYSYYVKRGNAYYLENIKADGMPIIYSNEAPRITHQERVLIKGSRKNLFALDGNIGRISNSTKIFIPKGSIKQNFNLDAQ